MVDELTLLDGTKVVSLPCAARTAGVSERTIRRWQSAGLLARLTTLRGTGYYRLVDVMETERLMRRSDPVRRRDRAIAQRLVADLR